VSGHAKLWAGASLAAFATMLAVSLTSCAALQKQAADPCSKVSWLTVAAGCKVRIANECVAGDKSCPVYVECTRARAEWQACK
jgi:hypothetical protein